MTAASGTLAAKPDIILVAPSGRAGAETFLGPEWKGKWRRVHRGPAESVVAELGAIVRLEAGDRVPRINGARLSIWVTELDQLEQALAAPGDWEMILFEPSEVASLDSVRQVRATLVAGRALPAGHVLRAEDLSTTVGGGGVAAELDHQLIGKVLSYHLDVGEDVTFGAVK